MRKFRFTIIDRYIIGKFLGTFFFTIIIIVVISTIFDLSEHIDDYFEEQASVHEVIFHYYLNFIPYFTILFSPLITFIAVIYFTSKMAYATEIIALLSSGMSFGRLLRPYFLAAGFIALFTFVNTNYLLPKANVVRLEFTEKYFQGGLKHFNLRNIHKQIRPGIYIYMESYSTGSNMGYKFSMEKFSGEELVSKLMADYVRWDSTKNKWTIRNYYVRDYSGLKEKITEGVTIDTVLNILPSDFASREETYFETMNFKRLNHYIAELHLQGSENISTFQVEKHRRIAAPFSIFILTFIGMTLSSKKVKGGIGMHIGAGLGLSFSYIFFMQFSSQYAISGSLSPILAAWLPNLIYGVICIFLYRLAPK